MRSVFESVMSALTIVQKTKGKKVTNVFQRPL